ncbi:Essential protein Yae1, N terminal [Trapelia coarctata]|nr:Essential protein Yae1, N terminal [Trapelia coarctata]
MEAERSSAEDERQHEAMQNIFSLRQTATSDLSFEKIFAPELWDEDGIWKWEVPSTPVVTEEAAEADHEITFPAVVAAHPAIKKWTKIVEDVMREWGVEKGVFEGEEWEAGRVGG